MPRIGCQTITFGDARIQKELPEVLELVRKAGYQGVEVGIRHLKLTEPGYYQNLFQEKSLQLVALHIGGNFLEVESVNKQQESLNHVVEFAHAMGVKFIITSGLVHQQMSDVEAEVERLAPAAKVCGAEDLIFCYHNHNWEIEHDARGLTYLCDHLAPGEFNLALDLGWVTRAGYSPVEMINRFRERIRYAHIKDVINRQEWAEVGHGDVNWDEVLPAIRSLNLPWWITEMDTTKKQPEESIAMSFAYLKDKVSQA